MAGTAFSGELMRFKGATWRVIAMLAAALVATPTLAIDSTKLQSIRSSLSVEEIVAFAMAKSTVPILDIDKTIEINIVLNAKGMERSDIQSFQIELLRVFSAISAYAEISINLNASRSIDYSSAVPYVPFGDQNQPSNTQTFDVFIDRDVLKLAKLGQIAVHDIDTLRSTSDASTCYRESRIGNPVVNVLVDRNINPVGCLYGVLLQTIGLKDAFGRDAATFNPGRIPGFRINAEMAAAYAIRECQSLIDEKNPFEKCLRDVLDGGKSETR
ncbi:hypothetical protein GGE16_000123 [Rhizobium leguminosarum]|uniref:Uncharacterized protein n=1 Tax=Rhizobium leguminosarum TaxID=384 RepID=A0AAE2MF72_RHILE|nr:MULTISPECIES: hypothetical protein [Rhizobium]MBB4288107.1 hypothetical protein [Rhizobium leguminosarum]MBB4295802.1 hypothetical protein [Rhizobium leguminosarum]MBB4307194.1 hypothetical protein [Rhizobium leguminosarum]MBB4417223.1 hypothetical protein [Rhizobium leguminosarum]MBB4432067.1 hypothetical protein [Rhizobium esperanzae]